MVACILVKSALKKAKDVKLAKHIIIGFITVFASWSGFAIFTWIGLIGTDFAVTNFERFGIDFGRGFPAWFLFGSLGVAVPSLIIAWIFTPIAYTVVKPVLIRHGVLPG